jgi:hypothetical protein
VEGVKGWERSALGLVFMGEHGLEIGVMEAQGALVLEEKIEEFAGDDVVQMPDRTVVLECHAWLEQWSKVSDELGAIATDEGGGGFRVQAMLEISPDFAAQITFQAMPFYDVARIRLRRFGGSF